MTAVVEQDLTGRLRACLVRQAATLAASGVRSVSLVGSVARGEGGPTSDVDLVTFKEALAAALGRKVDVLFKDGLRAYVAEAVERDALRLL